MKELLHIGERNSVKEYGSNPWDAAHGITMGPIVVNERTENYGRDIIQGNDSYENPTRGVIVNTVQFDAELIPIFTVSPPPVPQYSLQGFLLKASDIQKFFMPTQEYDAGVKFGILTCDFVTPRINVHDYTAHGYTEVHYDPSQNPWLGVYGQNDIYKHYLHTFPGKFAWAGIVLAGYDLTAWFGALTFGYTYSWYNTNPTSEDMIFVQFYGYPIFTAAQYAQILANPNTCNIAFTLYDGNSVNAIYSNADIIRGNKWAQMDTGQTRSHGIEP